MGIDHERVLNMDQVNLSLMNCMLCKQILNNPCMCGVCNSHFCYECLKDELKQEDIRKQSQAVQDQENIIIVRCQFCTHTDKLANIRRHERKCEHRASPMKFADQKGQATSNLNQLSNGYGNFESILGSEMSQELQPDYPVNEIKLKYDQFQGNTQSRNQNLIKQEIKIPSMKTIQVTIPEKKFQYLPSFQRAEEEMKDNVNHLRNRFIFNNLKVQQTLQELSQKHSRESNISSYSSKPHNPYLRQVLTQNIFNSNNHPIKIQQQNSQIRQTPNKTFDASFSKFQNGYQDNANQPIGYQSILDKYQSKNLYTDVILKELYQTRLQLQQMQQKIDNQQNSMIMSPVYEKQYTVSLTQPPASYSVPAYQNESFQNPLLNNKLSFQTDVHGNIDYENVRYDQKLEQLFGKLHAKGLQSHSPGYLRPMPQQNISINMREDMLPSNSTLVSFHSGYEQQ
ncbi:UNKNOWN [Stylonychia lemnae]|uniref:Uncharacterized protein n=1 Tax=Stylonychia lemnae TaxID=5949 RepID=A0A078A9S9_STYLE|nr:UNKNOWN [Stylonychia lemnae]|eukprot:CDW79025.1 UNKNOWN [Stylonychia lemnae]